MKTKQTLALLACIFLLFGCGGGDSSSTTPSPPPVVIPPPPPPPVPTNPGGIWHGVMYDQVEFSSIWLEAIFTETGEGRFFDGNGTMYIVSNVSGNDGDITMDFTAVAEGDYAFWDGSTFNAGTIRGTIVERVSFEGYYQICGVSVCMTWRISLKYDAEYERDSSLAKLEGMWDQSGFGILTFNADGTFFEQNVIGCVYDGQASIIDPDYNVYALVMTISLCGPYGLDGAYSGLGRLTDMPTSDGLAIDGLFYMEMNSDTRPFSHMLMRL